MVEILYVIWAICSTSPPLPELMRTEQTPLGEAPHLLAAASHLCYRKYIYAMVCSAPRTGPRGVTYAITASKGGSFHASERDPTRHLLDPASTIDRLTCSRESGRSTIRVSLTIAISSSTRKRCWSIWPRAPRRAPFLDQLSDVLPPSELDYIVINHMEPDHTGVIKVLQELAPQATILGSAKTVGMLSDFFQITEGVRAVEDGEELSLGEKTLQFFSTPFVHWPETMMTYEQTQKVLFTCDAFGGYGALRGAIFDDTYAEIDDYVQESLRYYVNIVARFSGPVLKAIDKVGGLAIDIIAPLPRPDLAQESRPDHRSLPKVGRVGHQPRGAWRHHGVRLHVRQHGKAHERRGRGRGPHRPAPQHL